jgi:hypothetical protein
MSYRTRRNRRVSSLGSVKMMFVFVAAVLGYADLQNSVSVMSLSTAKAAIPYINPKSRNNGDQRLPVTPTPLYVELDWGKNLPHDLDLWIRCYQLRDGLKVNMLSVGYKRTSDGWMDLQRDDQGEPSPLNKEVAQANSDVSHVPPGTVCSFNVHLYNSHGGALPVKGSMYVVQDKDSDSQRIVANTSFELKDPGQEITVVYAKWDNNGTLEKDSVKTYPAAPQTHIATVPLPEVGAAPGGGP